MNGPAFPERNLLDLTFINKLEKVFSKLKKMYADTAAPNSSKKALGEG